MLRKNKSEQRKFRVVLPFVVIVAIIFLITVSLSWQNITRFFARLGIIQPIEIAAVEEEYTHTIPSSQLRVGSIVAYYSFANDTSGNWNMTNMIEPVRTFVVIYPEDVHDMHIEDMSGNPISTISQGQSFNVVANVTNERTSTVTRAYIVQLVDPDSQVTQPINYNVMSVNPGTEEKNLVGPYIAEKTGDYTAQVFVWSNLASAGGFPIGSPENILLTSS